MTGKSVWGIKVSSARGWSPMTKANRLAWLRLVPRIAQVDWVLWLDVVVYCAWCLVMVHSILMWLCIMIHIMLWLDLYYDTGCIAMVTYHDTCEPAMFIHYDVYCLSCVWFLLLGFGLQVLCCLYLRILISMDVIQSWVRRVKARCVHVWSRLAAEANSFVNQVL